MPDFQGLLQAIYDEQNRALRVSGATLGFSLDRSAVKTAATYTAAANELVPVDTTSNSVTITLPTAPADKTLVGIKHIIRGSTNTVTYQCGGSDVFNKAGGGTSGTLEDVNRAVLLEYDSQTAIWTIIADDYPKSVLDAAYAPLRVTVPADKTNDYTATAADANASTGINKATAVNVTINTSVFTAGDLCEYRQVGAGQVTLVAGSGVTLRAPNGLKTRVQYSAVSILALGSEMFSVQGDCTT